MDQFYDKLKAAELIEELAKERREQHAEAHYLSEVTLGKEWQKRLDFIQRLTPSEWRLVSNGESDVTSEPMFALHGAISWLDLPPLRTKVNPKRATFLRQGLTVTGYGSPSFARAIQAVSKIYALFSRDIGKKNMAEIQCVGNHQGFQSLNSSSRYLTRRDQAQDFHKLIIPQSMDPHGHLSNIAGDRFTYTDDNEVVFYERKISDSGDREFIDISPSKIQIGNIVEVHMTFMAVPVKDGKKKVMATLRSVTLLDGNLTEMAIAAKADLHLQSTTVPKKRGIHEGEMVTETGRKFSRLQIRD